MSSEADLATTASCGEDEVPEDSSVASDVLDVMEDFGGGYAPGLRSSSSDDEDEGGPGLFEDLNDVGQASWFADHGVELSTDSDDTLPKPEEEGKDLLALWLSSRTSVPAVRLLAWLQPNDTSVEQFIRIVSRGGSTTAKDVAPPTLPEEDVTSPAFFAAHCDTLMDDRMIADTEEERLAVRQSHDVMELLCSTPRHVESFLDAKATRIARVLFETFRPASRGNFYHTCRCIQRLLQSHPDAVATAISSDGVESSKRTVGAMMNYLHVPIVADCFMQCLVLSHTVSAGGGAGTAATQGLGMMGMMGLPSGMHQAERNLYSRHAAGVSLLTKLAVHDTFAKWKVAAVLATHVQDPLYPEAHVAAAADVVEQLLVFFTADTHGELVLRPVADADFVSRLVQAAATFAWLPAPVAAGGSVVGGAGGDGGKAGAAAAGTQAVTRRQTRAMGLLAHLARLAVMEEVPSPTEYATTTTGVMTPRMVSNTLAKMRVDLVEAMVATVPQLCVALEVAHAVLHPELKPLHKVLRSNNKKKTKKTSSAPVLRVQVPQDDVVRPGPLKHPGHKSTVPFGFFRLDGLRLIATLVEHEPSVLEGLSPGFWGCLVTWFNTFRDNNMLHGCFFRILRIAVLCNHEPSLQCAFGDFKLLAGLVNHWQLRSTREGRSSATGTVLQVLNLIRLRMETLAPDTWLRYHVAHHALWDSFLPELMAATQFQQAKQYPTEVGSYNGFMSRVARKPSPQPTEVAEVDLGLGSPFAKELGLPEGLTAYVAPPPAPSAGAGETASAPEPHAAAPPSAPSKSKRRRNKKGKGKGGGGGGAPAPPKAPPASSGDTPSPA